MSDVEEPRPPFPPFTEESAWKKVKAAQDGWNTRYEGIVKLALVMCGSNLNTDGFFLARCLNT